MKKVKLFGLVMVSALILFNVQIKGEDNLSGSWLENIEVLSQDENGDIYCLLTGSLDCPSQHSKAKYIVR
jgi:hypothetical protein